MSLILASFALNFTIFVFYLLLVHIEKLPFDVGGGGYLCSMMLYRRTTGNVVDYWENEVVMQAKGTFAFSHGLPLLRLSLHLTVVSQSMRTLSLLGLMS